VVGKRFTHPFFYADIPEAEPAKALTQSGFNERFKAFFKRVSAAFSYTVFFSPQSAEKSRRHGLIAAF